MAKSAFRRGSAARAATIGCTEDEYLRQLRAGYEWCARCPGGGRWIRAERMSSTTTGQCKACHAAAAARRKKER